MAKVFEIDLDKFARALGDSLDIAAEGAKSGMHDSLELWRVKSTNIAPIGRYKGRRGGNLRARIEPTPVDGSGLNLEGSVVANAYNDGFNYAFFLHERGKDLGYSARTPGTTLTFLDDVVKKDGEKFVKRIEKAIAVEIKKAGW